jgi:hypothetical protein
MQLVYQHEEHIEFAHRSQASRHLSQPSAEFAAGISSQAKDRNQLAHSPRRDANPMKGRDISMFERVEATGKAVQSRFQQFDDAVGSRHGGKRRLGHDVGWKRAIIVALCA